MEEKNIVIEKSEYINFLKQLSKAVMLVEVCYISLQLYNDEYEKQCYEQDAIRDRTFLEKAIKDLKELERNLKMFEKNELNTE